MINRHGLKLNFVACLGLLSALTSIAMGQSLRTLIVGGGPNPQNNQVAIESNVRYILRALPNGSWKTVLFCSGDPKESNVLYKQTTSELSKGETLLNLIQGSRGAARPSKLNYRESTIPQVDGAAKTQSISDAFDKLKGQIETTPGPTLLYFTGHGSPRQQSRLENNQYDLWGGGRFTVQDLASQMEKLPADQPVILVMVQCYSGSFANVLYEKGDPQGTFVNRDIAGFFATVKEKTAAGCTPELDENEYHDFTSYFFAALTGQDRLGRKVTGADYNRDGKISMDEAYCYTVLHDVSIDIPVCTSDLLVRKLIVRPDDETFAASYRAVLKWATPGQKVVLEGLSKDLGLVGDDRALTAYKRFIGDTRSNAPAELMVAAQRAFTRAREDARSAFLGRFPDMRTKLPNGIAARREAISWLEGQSSDPTYQSLLDADLKVGTEEDAGYLQEITDARTTRFVRMFKTVALTQAVRQSGDRESVTRLEKLLVSERRVILNRDRRSASAK